MKIVDNNHSIYSLCPICEECLGFHEPVISMSYGFKEGHGEQYDIYAEESVIIHADCADSSVLSILLEKVEQR